MVGLPALLMSGSPRGGVVSGFYAVLLAWVGVSLLWTVSPWDTAGSLLHWLALLGVGILASRIDARGKIWVGVALGVSVSLPFVLLQVLGYSPVRSLASVGFPGNAGLYLTDNVLAEVAVVAVVLMGTQRRWGLVVAPALCALLSGRSEVLLMLLAAGLVWTATRRYAFAALLIGAGLLLAVLLAGYDPWPDSMHTRFQIWSVVVSNLSILGAGFGTFGTLLPVYGFAHNEPLQLMFELGVGSILVFGVVGYVFIRAPNAGDKAALAALAASGLVWAPLQDPSTSFLFVLLVGTLFGDIRRLDWVAALQRAYRVRGAPRSGSYSSRKVRPSRAGSLVVAL
jgi:hypothetical protein